MCGIAGMLSHRTPVTRELLQAMCARMEPRGPDSSGEWIGEDGMLGFGHRRLAIIDLSQAGAQPMHSACGRYSVTYNGEIYNFAAIRAELDAAGKAPVWRGHSDTEVLLAAIAAWGLRAALERSSGMFALALWDRERRTLSLARDRFGEKPLYYGWTRTGFAFASTLGPIAATPGFDNPIDPAALAGLLSRACIAAPLTIRQGIHKLPPGCMIEIAADRTRSQADLPPVTRWFDYGAMVLAGAADPIGDEAEALDLLEEALRGAVGRQLVADVPVGTFLSGGIDSSLITAIARQSASRPIRTFTIGFAEAGFDEAVWAKKVAAALGTDHTELYVDARDARNVIPALPAIYDEPFADSSQIPTYLVSRLARSEVTVSLSGDAGDELFGGYNRHVELPRLWRRLEIVPVPLRRLGLGAAGTLPADLWNRLGKLAGRGSVHFGDKARRAIRAMSGAGSFEQLYDSFLDTWPDDALPVAGCGTPQSPASDPRLLALPLEVRAMHADAMSYLPDDILAKVDRAAMAVSLESRVPFLDPEVAALAARIAPSLKFGNGGGKAILKQLLYRFVPRELVDRPKAGFAMPVGDWLRGPLRDWAEDLLSPQALAADGLLDPAVICARWHGHLSGREDAAEALWPVLMYQAWRGTV